MARAAVVTLVLATILGTSTAAFTASRSSTQRESQKRSSPPSAFQTIESCLENAAEPVRLLALMVVDESGSIKQTDPNDTRITGIRTLVMGLSQLVGQRTDGQDISVDVRITTFGDRYRGLSADSELDTASGEGETGWWPINEATLDRISTRVDDVAGRKDRPWTDYLVALDGARGDLAGRSAEVTREGSTEVCKLLVFFTDGELDLADDREEEAAIRSLCTGGGVTDRLRADDVVMVSVGLATGPGGSEFLAFLEALTTGRSSGAASCGTTASADMGLFLHTSDADELFRLLGGILKGPVDVPLTCPPPLNEPDCSFEVHEGFIGFSLDIQVPSGDTEIELRSPLGERELLRPGEDRSGDRDSFTGAELGVTWPGAREALVELEALPGETIVGTWAVRVARPEGELKPESVNVDVRLLASLTPKIRDGAMVRRGMTVKRELGFDDRDGNPVTSAPVLGDVQVDAKLRDPAAGDVTALEVEEQEEGRYPIEITVDEDYQGKTIDLVLDATVDEDGEDVSIDSNVVVLEVGPPPGFPDVNLDTQLPSIRGRETAKGTIVIAGDEQDAGCVWFEVGGVNLPFLHDDVPARTAEVVLQPDATTEDECITVAPGEQQNVSLEVRPAAEGEGVARVALDARLTSSGSPGREERETVETRFDMRPAPDAARAWAIFALLLLLGIGIPVGLLGVWASWATGAEWPALRRADRAGVKVTPRGVSGPSGEDIGIAADRFERVDDQRRAGAVRLTDDLRVRRRLGGSLRHRLAGFLTGAEAVVIHRDGRIVVAGSPGASLSAYPLEPAHQVPHWAAPFWVFSVRGEIDDSLDETYQITGVLTYVVPDSGDYPERARQLAEDAARALPELVEDMEAMTPRRRWAAWPLAALMERLRRSTTSEGDDEFPDDLIIE